MTHHDQTSTLLCDPASSHLLIIDIQEKLSSAMPADVLANVVRNTNILIQAATALAIPLHVTEQYPKGLGHTVADIKQVLTESATVTNKTCFSACSAAEISAGTTGKPAQFILVGMEAHICVLQTALDLLQRGHFVFVVTDAVCSRFKSHYKNALARLSQAGVILSNTESVLFEWLRDAGHEQFKTLSRLIR